MREEASVTDVQLVVDVGNTESVVGVVGGGGRELHAHWRVSTQVPRTADEMLHLLRGLMASEGFERAHFERAVLGSVVPAASHVLATVLPELVDGELIEITPGSPLPIRLEVDEPRTVGADRIVNTLAARELYDVDTLAIDLGTATTFDLITADGAFLGGVIAPGVSSGLEWLGRRAAKLPRVELAPPERVIGRNTEACIRSGIFFSVVDAIDGMVRRIRAEWEREGIQVVATGGFAEAVGPHCETVDRIEPFLTLYGLALAGVHIARRS